MPDLTPATLPPTRKPETNLRARIKSQVRRDQLICLAITAALIAGIFLLEPSIKQKRSKLVQSSDKSIGQLLLTFPRLALGGFRGILAMALWKNAEHDKNVQKWRPLETDYNAIAALEPYFASDYIFNAWNMSYNLSAQYHGLDTKYKWVLDGLVYLYKGEHYVPDNANMIINEANDFFLKLGTSFERKYYCARWRYDIAHLYRYQPGQKGKNFGTLPEVYFIVHQPEFKCKLLPALDGKGPIGHGVRVGKIHYRYGLSVFYFAWVEYGRAMHQPKLPTDSGIEVLESWQPMALRLWCRDDIYYAQRLTNHIFSEPEAKMLRRFPARVRNILDCYRNVAINGPRDIREWHVYLQKFPDQYNVHHQHLLETRYFMALAKAEKTMFEGLVAWQNNDRKFRIGDRADRYLLLAISRFKAAMAAFHTYLHEAYPRTAGFPKGMGRGGQMKFMRAMEARIAGIESFRLTAQRGVPNLSFLDPVTLSDSD